MQYHYRVKLSTDEYLVCREGFASLHGVGTGRVRRVASLVGTGGIPVEKRGTHNNHPSVSREAQAKVEDHIRSFPFRVSHYGGISRKIRFLDCNLSVTKMYTTFLEKHFPEEYLCAKAGAPVHKIKCEIKYKYYLQYFKDNFNYAFGRPRSDVCGTCTELEAKIKVEQNPAAKRSLQEDLMIHKNKAKTFYRELKRKTTLAESTLDTETISFDFKQNIPYPHLPVGEIFYARQLWLYIFGITSGKTGKCTIYAWTESEGKRGSNEVITCVNHYIENHIDPSVKNLFVFTDGCKGQNNNYGVLHYWQTLVLKGRFERIEHRLPIRGHSFLPCDRNFGVIERIQRKEETVEWSSAWLDKIRSKFEVHEMKGLFRNFVESMQPYFKKTTATKGKKLLLTESKIYIFHSGQKYDLTVSCSMSGIVRETHRLLKPGVSWVPEPSTYLYTTPLPIKRPKLEDIKKLQKYLSPTTVALIATLTASESADESGDEDLA